MTSRKPVPSVKEQLAAAGASMRDVSFIGDVPLSRNKYGAESVETEEWGTFDSRLEYETWLMLLQREKAGEISQLRRQVRYDIQVGRVLVTTYVCDFEFTEDGQKVVADAKGTPTPVYLMKYRLFYALYGKHIREYTKDGISPPRKLRLK